MKQIYILFIGILIITQGCIGDDFVDDEIPPEIRISCNIVTLSLDTTYQFQYTYLNNVGKEEDIQVTWKSDNPSILEIGEAGIALAKKKGTTSISVTYDDNGSIISDTKLIEVSEKTQVNIESKTGSITTTSSYKLSGDFNITANGTNLLLEFEDNYTASTALPGLYVYLSNNKNTVSSALEIGKVIVFDGNHSYTISDTDINQYRYLVYYCKPFNVKVGDGEIN